MTRQLIVVPGAESDILDAYLWYEDRQKGLGHRFVAELDSTYERILSTPQIYREVESSIRQALTHTFPYLEVFYTVGADAVYILAVIHAAQDPTYIRSRIGA